MYGREARIPADLAYGPPEVDGLTSVDQFVAQHQTTLREAFSIVREKLDVAATRRKQQYDMRTRPSTYNIGDRVWFFLPRRRTGLCRKWQSFYDGPYLVTDIVGPVNVVIRRTPKSKPKVVHVDKLKHYHLPSQPEPSDSPDSASDTPDQDVETADDINTPEKRPRRNVRLPARFL